MSKGNIERKTISEFTSETTELLSVDEVKEKLLKLDYIQEELKEWTQK